MEKNYYRFYIKIKNKKSFIIGRSLSDKFDYKWGSVYFTDIKKKRW